MNTTRPCDHLCHQGRNHECQMPDDGPYAARALVLAVALVALAAFLSSITWGIACPLC